MELLNFWTKSKVLIEDRHNKQLTLKLTQKLEQNCRKNCKLRIRKQKNSNSDYLTQLMLTYSVVVRHRRNFISQIKFIFESNKSFETNRAFFISIYIKILHFLTSNGNLKLNSWKEIFWKRTFLGRRRSRTAAFELFRCLQDRKSMGMKRWLYPKGITTKKWLYPRVTPIWMFYRLHNERRTLFTNNSKIYA